MSEAMNAATERLIRRHKPYPEHKDSGVEWIGEIPAHWLKKRLKFSVYLINFKVSSWDDEQQYIGLENIESWTGRLIEKENNIEIEGASNRFENDDVLFGKLRPYLAKVYHASKSGICSSELLVFRQRDIHPRFLTYYMLNSDFINIIDSSTYGAKMPRANGEFVGNMPALIPPKKEQDVIAKYLDKETARIDTLIEKKERLIKLLQEKRSALITHAVTKGLDPTVPMKDSGVEWIGEMPAHWNVMALKYATATRKGAVKTGPFGSQLLSSEMISGEIKVYNQRNVIDHDFRSGENYVTKKKFHELKEFSIFPDDVLITTRGTISQCAIFPLDAEMGILHPCLIRVQPNPQSMIPKYLALVIQDSEIVKLQLLLMSNATTIDVIYSDSLKNVKLPLPPVHEQEAIIDYIQSINKKIGMLVTKTKESITFFKEYRTALISAAVTGKIDVREEVL